jgi:putative peptidoglycan lipid II flippase
MAAGTLVSRVTGLGRTAGLAAVLGVGLASDAYIAASVVPTMLLVLVTGGTLSSALVPMLSRGEDESARRRAAGTALAGLSALAAAASVALALAAPVLARLLSLGARGQPDHDERIRLVTILLILVAPQVFLLAVTAVTSAVLTARGRLGVVGWTPVAVNLAFLLSLIGFAVVVPASAGQVPLIGLMLLGLGSTAAVAVGSAIQLRAAASHLPPYLGMLKNRDRDMVRELRRTGGWTLLYAVANQIGLIIIFAVAARRNGVGSAYQWSFTVMQLPFALVGVTLLSATLPALARAADDLQSFNRVVRRSSEPLLALLVPCAAGLALFAPLIAGLLVGHGASDAQGTALVAHGVALFATALIPFTAFQLMTRSCYALRRPSWPALANLAVNTVTVAGALLALRPSGAEEILSVLVLSYALSYVIGCLILGTALRRTGVILSAGLLRPAVTSGFASAVAAGAVLGLRAGLPASWVRDLASVAAFGGATLVGVVPWLKARNASSSRDDEAPPPVMPAEPDSALR